MSWGSIDWTLTLGASVGVATIVQAGAAIVMVRGLHHARRSAEAATATLRAIENTAERQLRAYVEAHQSTAELVTGQDAVVRVLFKNAGQTPARAVRADFRIEIIPLGDIDNIALPDLEDQPEGTIAPGAQMGIEQKIPWAKWMSERPALESGDKVVVVVGLAEYQDIYGKARRTLIRRYRSHGATVPFLHSASGGDQST